MHNMANENDMDGFTPGKSCKKDLGSRVTLSHFQVLICYIFMNLFFI